MSRCYVIAEAGVNHNGSLDLARQMVLAAKKAGADAVKFQTFKAELLVTPDAAKAEYQKARTGADQTQFDMLKGLELSYAQFEELNDLCTEQGIEFLSTPFDEQSANFLNRLGMRRFKIPSGEATNIRLIKRIASFGKPVLLSTGMCTLEEVRQALDWIAEVNSELPVWIFQCVSAYPAQAKDTNLKAMNTMREEFGVPVGLSDHSEGTSIALAATALGAVAIEKHFTLDIGLSGPDHAASLPPDDLERMISGIRDIELAMGDGVKSPTEDEKAVALVARRSIVAARALPKGATLHESDLELRRPGTGVSPKHLSEFVGRVLAEEVHRNALLDWSMLV